MKIKINFLQLVKLCFFAMLFYSSFLMELLEIKIANLTMILGLLTTVVMLADMAIINFNPLAVITSDIKRLLLFVVLCALGSLAVAAYPLSAVEGLFQFLQCLLLMAITIFICIRDGSVTFCARTIVIVMLVAVMYALMNAETFDERLTLSETGNANVFGHNAVIGICLSPLAFDNKTFVKRLLRIALGILFALGVIYSASRMSFIALIGYLALYLLVVAHRRTGPSLFSHGIRFLGTIGLAVIVLILIEPYLRETLIAERMEELLSVLNGSDGDGEGRIFLYEQAWILFCKNPIFGIGYSNFNPRYGAYTHSTYAEILACTGLVGSLTFLSYYLYILRMIFKGMHLDKRVQEDTNYRLFLVFIVLLLLGIGEILIYKIKYFIVFGIFAAQFYMNKQKIASLVAEPSTEGDKE